MKVDKHNFYNRKHGHAFKILKQLKHRE